MDGHDAFMAGFEDALEKKAGKVAKAARLVKARRAARAAGDTGKADRLTGIISKLRSGMRGGERVERISRKKRWGRDVGSGSFRSSPKKRGAVRKPLPLSHAISPGFPPMIQTMRDVRAARARSLAKARSTMKKRYMTTRWLSGGNRRG